jgi:hypothetical protein
MNQEEIIKKFCPFCNEELEKPYIKCDLCGFNKEILKDLLFNEDKFEEFSASLVKKLVETNIEIKLLREELNNLTKTLILEVKILKNKFSRLIKEFDEMGNSVTEMKAYLYSTNK